MKKIAILIILFSIISTWVFAKNVLKLSVLDFPPYEFINDNQVQGISVDIVKEVFKKMNQPISIILLPWSRALVYLKNGKIDGVFQILKKSEREKFVDYSNVVLINEIVDMFVLQDSDIVFEGDLSKLKDLRFGVRKDFSYGHKFDEAIKNKVIHKVTTSNYQENLLSMLSMGRIDILIGDKYGIPFLYKKMKLNKKNKLYKKHSKIKALSQEIQVNPAYMAFSKRKNLQKIRDEFDEILLEMKKEGTYSDIINK